VGSLNYFSIDGGRVHGEMDPSFGLVIDYAHQPFRLYEAECSDAAGNNCMIIPGREPTSIVGVHRGRARVGGDRHVRAPSRSASTCRSR
jgi:hypothetical protein